MAQKTDGSQYDGPFPWDEGRMIDKLAETMEAVEAATNCDARKHAREVAKNLADDLYALHGVDLRDA